MNARENILTKLPVKRRKLLSNLMAVVLVLSLTAAGFAVYKAYEVKFRGVKKSEYVMGTNVEIKINGPNARRHAQEAITEMKRIADLINYYDEDSELSNINKMSGITAVAVSSDTFDIIKKALKISQMSYGDYDITIGPLMDVWNFSVRERKEIPSGNELVYSQHLVNYKNIDIDSRSETVKLLYPGMKIDLGSIAKGYAIAKARAVLIKQGVKSALISTGSSITVIGDNRGKPWKIGIRNPRKPDDILGVIKLKPGQALSTSGDYEKFFEVGGKRYHHIISPKTAMPAVNIQSVTIISDEPWFSDAISTAVFVMGPKRGMRFVRRLSNVNAIIVDKNGNITTTPGLILEK